MLGVKHVCISQNLVFSIHTYAHITIYQTADGEECKGGPAHFDQDNKSPGCCDQTMTSATSSSHSPTLSAASYPRFCYQRNASQVEVNSKAHVVWWPSVD